MPEYRPLPEAYEREFARTWSYAFRPESGPHEYDPDEVPPPAWSGSKRGLFEDGELLAICKHQWFTCRVGDDWLPVGGVASLATLPEHRREGYVRRLLAETLSEYREREIPIAALWPFKGTFYARFGWALAGTHARLTVQPGTLSFARAEQEAGDEDEGTFVRLEADDYERLVSVLSAHAADQNLATDRTEEWWRTQVFSGRETDPYVYGWERNGEIRGYVVYRVEKDDSRELHAVERAWVDHEARLALLAFLADHDSQVDAVHLYGPDASLLDVVPNPGDVDVELEAGPMARLVDVGRALRERSYPDDASGSVVLDVDDAFADWNDARFELAIEDGKPTVEHVENEEGTDGTATEPDVDLEVGALSQLYLGYRSIDDLARTGEAVLADDGARDVLADAFPDAQVFLREVF